MNDKRWIIELQSAGGVDYSVKTTADSPAEVAETCKRVLGSEQWCPEDAESSDDFVDAWTAFCRELLGCEPEDKAKVEDSFANQAEEFDLELVDGHFFVTRDF